jgi:hypothetical protein
LRGALFRNPSFHYSIASLPNYQIFLMDLSTLTPGIVTQVASMVESYIENSREKYASKSVPLGAEQSSQMQLFFPDEILDRVRWVILRGTRIQDPQFYTMARIMGIKHLPSFSDTSAVTFIDVIVSHEEFTPALLFHELVHVVQYAQLGVKEFASRYVSGFLKAGSYAENPLEKHAFELEQQFSANPASAFSVPDEVKRWIGLEQISCFSRALQAAEAISQPVLPRSPGVPVWKQLSRR